MACIFNIDPRKFRLESHDLPYKIFNSLDEVELSSDSSIFGGKKYGKGKKRSKSWGKKLKRNCLKYFVS